MKFILLLLFALPSFAQTCASFNHINGPFPHGKSDTTNHISGNHSWTTQVVGNCYYTGLADAPCVGRSESTVSASDSDYGVTYLAHDGLTTTKSGGHVGAPGMPTSSDAASAVSVSKCVIPGCAISPTISGSGGGVGLSVTFPASQIFGDQFYYKNDCGGASSSAPRPCGEPYPHAIGVSTDGTPILVVPDACPGSPIIIDTQNTGFKLSNPAVSCVMFDLKATGDVKCYSWPVAGSGNGFLVLDRNLDRKITTGAELFGNFTPQTVMEGRAKNGFIALGEYDKPEHGGNLDGVINKDDAVWPKLKVWVDTHCADSHAQCTSLWKELHSLSEYSITEVSYVYTSSDETDRWGNEYRYWAQTNPDSRRPQWVRPGVKPRKMKDVWLQAK